MSFITCNLFSVSLGMATSINVIIPEKFRQMEREGGFPTLYLLHGLSDDNSAWCRYTSIEKYAEKAGVIVVMPWGGKSFYTDMKYGEKVFSYISRELPEFCEKTFPISKKREDRFVAGLSMGGYGAFKFALSNTESYAAAASLSGALDVVSLLKRSGDLSDAMALKNAIFGEGDDHTYENDDLFQLLDKAVSSGADMPKMFMICGTEDFLYQDNINFSKQLEKLVPDAKIRWEPGVHDWYFWDKHIQEVLEWLPIKE